MILQRIDVLTPARLGILLSLCLPATVVAQVEVWHLGKGGDSWTSQALSQSGALDVDGALQPLELQVNENLVDLLRASGLTWLNGQPPDFVATGQPRAWSNDGLFNQLNGPIELVDGDPDTHSAGIFKTARNQAGAAFFFDLGAPFPINRLRFFPTPDDPDAFIKAFRISINDGEEFNEINRPVYQLLRRVEVNRDMVVDLDFAATQGRYLELVVLSKGAFNLAEFEIYGEGFVPIADYVSQLHSFGSDVNFGNVRVHTTRLQRLGATGKAPSALLQMRTGLDDTPLTYFRRDRDTGSQEIVDESEYLNRLPRRALLRLDPDTGQPVEEVERSTYVTLPPEEQGPVRDFVQGDIRDDTEAWSPWSRGVRLDSTGAIEFPVGLPSPREFLQFRVLFNGDARNAIRLDTLQVEFSPGLVSEAIGEVALAADPVPVDGIVEVLGGVDTTFVYDIRTEFSAGGLAGYRGIRVEAFPPPVFESLQRGDPLTPAADAVISSTDGGFDVRFDPVSAATNEPLRVTFRMRLLEHNTPINAWLLGDDDVPPHPVLPGDASDALATNVTNAFTTTSEAQVEAQLSSSVVTPNADGVNDETRITLIMSQFASVVDVRVGIYDLAGRRVRTLVDERRSAGAYDEAWDGRDDGGSVVPPGLYLCRVSVDADADAFDDIQPIGVAY